LEAGGCEGTYEGEGAEGGGEEDGGGGGGEEEEKRKEALNCLTPE